MEFCSRILMPSRVLNLLDTQLIPVPVLIQVHVDDA